MAKHRALFAFVYWDRAQRINNKLGFSDEIHFVLNVLMEHNPVNLANASQLVDKKTFVRCSMMEFSFQKCVNAMHRNDMKIMI